MSRSDTRREPDPSALRHPLVAGVLVLGLLLSLAAWWTLARHQRQESDQRFEMQVLVRQQHLVRHVDHLQRLARSFQGLFLASREVSAQEFAAHFDVLQVARGLPEVLSVRYENCPDAQVCAGPVFLGTNGQALSDLALPVVAAVSADAVAVDEDSRDRNLTVMHAPLRLNDGRVALQISAPVYRGGEGDPGSVESRRENQAGHLRVLVDAARLMQVSRVGGAEFEGLQLQLSDVGGVAEGHPLQPIRPVHADPGALLPVSSRDRRDLTFEVGERLWRMSLVRPQVEPLLGALPLLALTSGLALTAAAVALVMRLLRRASRSEAECRRLDGIVADDDARLRSIARHDGLTGLLNREAFQELLAERLHLWALQPVEAGRLVLVQLDLDRFQKINEMLGHGAGDQVLLAVGERLCRLSGLPAEPVLQARLGGDEFMLLFQGPVLADEGVIEALARQLVDRLGQPLQVGSHTLRPGCSLGVAWVEAGAVADLSAGVDDIGLMVRADRALHQAKRAGRAQFRVDAGQDPPVLVDQLRLEADLHHALERRELELFFQPQFDGHTLQVVGAEALLRWRHPQLGMVPPDRFIALAEESGLIVPIGRWVIDEACRQAAQWSALACRPIGVAVNVSVRQMLGDDIAAVVEQALRRHALPAQRLELEITESLAVGDVVQARALLARLADLGVSVAIDDFGVGYSSLAYLRDLPVQRVKIDRSFLRQVPQDAGSSRLVGAMVSMARALEIGLVAEGVETVEQLDFLCEQGCDAIQGYLLGRPIAGDDFLHRLMADDFGHRGRDPASKS
ncbi:MAG: hypothetical protein RL654_1911 [Pseudomonadota bacterium]